MLSFMLWLAAMGAYASAGWHIGSKSLEIQRDQNLDDKWAPFLFPAQRANGKIDEAGLLRFLKELDTDSPQAWYKLIMMVIWPLKLGWCGVPYSIGKLPAAGGYLKRKWLEAVEKRREAKLAERDLKERLVAVDNKYLPAPGDQPLQLHEKREELRKRRENIDHAIDRIDSELDLRRAQLETIDAEEPPKLTD